MTTTPRAPRMSLMDRPWVGHRTVMLATPLAARPVAEVRRVLGEFLRRHPRSPLACRLDVAASRWRPVPEEAHATHLDRMVVTAPDPDPADLEAHIAAHSGAGTADLPFVVVVGPSSVLIDISHAVGDAVTASRLVLATARADLVGFAAAADRTRTPTVVRALADGIRPHHRQWLHHLRHPAGPPAVAPAYPAPLRPAFAEAVLDGATLKAVTRWRNANAPGVSLTCVLTSATHHALVGEGVPVHADGHYTLIDVRSYLPDPGLARYGNLAKSVYLSAPVGDPVAVSRALKETTASVRAIPAMVLGSAAGAVSRPHAATGHPAGAPVVLTFNSVPTLPGLSDLPWVDGEPRRFVGFSPSTGAGGVTVFALRMRDHMQLTASFDESTAPVDAVRAALNSIPDALGRV